MNSARFSAVDKNRSMTCVCLLVLAAIVAIPTIAQAPATIPYPADYRNWVHVKTAVVGPKTPIFASDGGIHHIYANSKAMEGLRGGAYADGAEFVFDLREYEEKDGVVTEGPRRRIDLMLKNATEFSATGGWGFERFLGGSETARALTEENRKQCFACHEQRKDRQFVFSEYRK